MTFKKTEMEKPLGMRYEYEWNGPPQQQMVRFCNLVGTDIAPVSKKTAVKVFCVFYKKNIIHVDRL